jgi:hypothetical protein
MGALDPDELLYHMLNEEQLRAEWGDDAVDGIEEEGEQSPPPTTPFPATNPRLPTFERFLQSVDSEAGIHRRRAAIEEEEHPHQHFNPKQHAYLVAHFARWNARPDGQMSANDGVWWGFDDYEEAVQCAKEASSTRSAWRDIPREDYLLLAVAKEGVIFEPRKEEGQS